MKKYKFKLAALEKNRKQIEEQKKVELSRSMQEMRKLEAELSFVDESERKARRSYAALGEPNGNEPVAAASFWVIDQFSRGQRIRRDFVKRNLENQEEKVKADYAAYLKARQNLKVIETLHEKDLERHQAERQKYERKQIDELYVMRDRLSVRHSSKGDADE